MLYQVVRLNFCPCGRTFRLLSSRGVCRQVSLSPHCTDSLFCPFAPNKWKVSSVHYVSCRPHRSSRIAIPLTHQRITFINALASAVHSVWFDFMQVSALCRKCGPLVRCSHQIYFRVVSVLAQSSSRLSTVRVTQIRIVLRTYPNPFIVLSHPRKSRCTPYAFRIGLMFSLCQR